MPVFASRGVTRRPDPPSWETDDVPVVLVGTALWGVALVVLLVLDLAGLADVHRWELAMCLCGVALGLVGVRYCRRRQAAVARSAADAVAPAAAAPPERPTGPPPRA